MVGEVVESGAMEIDENAVIGRRYNPKCSRSPRRIGREDAPLGCAVLAPTPDESVDFAGYEWSGVVYRDGCPFFDVSVYEDDEDFASLVAQYTGGGRLDRRLRCALWLARARRYLMVEFFQSFGLDLDINSEPIPCVWGTDDAPLAADARSAHFLWHCEGGGGIDVRCDFLGVECGNCMGCKAADRAHPMPASRVYFIQACGGGPVKIGRSADPRARIATLQTANPDHLRIVATMPGGVAVERMLHRMFERHRVRPDGEWFNPEPEVLAFIRELGGRPA